MYKGKKIIGIIPARGGSKGLPRKNIRKLGGKPLVAWTILSARKSKYLDKVIVSTENAEIAAISKRYGAEVPFMRPAKFAADKANIADAIFHALDYLKKEEETYDICVLLQPTSPLRRVCDIDGAIETMIAGKAKAIISVCEAEHHPFKANTLPADGCMKDFMRPDIKSQNRQEMPVFYRLNGAIFAAYVDYLKLHRNFFGEKTFAYMMPAGRSIDIDSEIDLRLAELLMRESYE